MQTQLFACTFGIGVYVVGRQKLTALLDRAGTDFIDVVPDKIYRASHTIKQLNMLVFYSNL